MKPLDVMGWTDPANEHPGALHSPQNMTIKDGFGLAFYMSMLVLLMAVVSCLSGCSTASAEPSISPAESIALGRGELWFAEAEAAVVPLDIDNVDPIECNCGGSGRSGDGLGPCPCGGNCPCSAGDPFAPTEATASDYKGPLIEDRWHFVIRKNENCIHCKRWLRTELPKLQREGYKVGMRELFINDLPQYEVAGTATILVGFRSAEVLKQVLHN